MRKFKGSELPAGAGGSEKLKLIAMSVALLLVVGTYVFSEMRRKDIVEEPNPDLPALGEATIEVPQPPPGLFDSIADGTEEERVLIEHDELEVLLAYVRSLSPAHYETAGTRDLDGNVAAELAADTASARGAFVSVRGELVELRERVSPSGSAHRAALLRTADDQLVHLRTPRLADRTLQTGDWARLDGLYFKQLADQDPAGEWVTAPLVVGSALQRSYEDFGPVPEIERELIAGISDDYLDSKGSFSDMLRWRVLAWMRDMPEGQVDWEQTAELNGELLDKILADGDAYRGQTFVLPTSRVQAINRKTVGENPARLDHVYESWIGNTTWLSTRAATIFVLSSAGTAELKRGDLTEGKLVFLRNMAYDTPNNVRRIAPVFAAHELTAFVEEQDLTLFAFGVAFIGLMVVLALVIAILWRRDQAKSKALQEKLVERRRARRLAAQTSQA